MFEVVREFLENWWQILVPSLIIIVFARRLGLFATVKASEMNFPGGLFFYRDM